VTMVYTPCSQMDDLRPGPPKEIRGRRGTLCRIVKGGIIRQGDAIEKLAWHLTVSYPSCRKAPSFRAGI
jgi:MOSC domain-containing protein YiiM